MTRNEFLSHFENVCELFDQIGSIGSRTAKESLLANYQDAEFLKEILFYCYNPYYIYGIDKKRIEVETYHNSVDSHNTVFELLDYLRENNTGKFSDCLYLWSFYKSIDNDFLVSYIKKIILKDLKIGVNIETINKVFPKLIPTFKVGLCKTYETEKDLRYENYIVQPKLDGVRIIAICTGGSAELFTRNGMKVEGYDDVVADLSHPDFKDIVFDGEIMTDNFDGTMEGLFALKKDKKAIYNIFDILTLQEFNEKKSAKPYSVRYAEYGGILLNLAVANEVNNLKPVIGTAYTKSQIVESIELLDMYAREGGYEGLVLKGFDSLYEFKRSYAWTKYKAWHTEDFEVTGMEEGTGKYEGMLGALVLNANGVKVKVGSGFSDEQRDKLWNNYCEPIGMIAEVRYQEKTKDGSLRFPTFIKFRNDI